MNVIFSTREILAFLESLNAVIPTIDLYGTDVWIDGTLNGKTYTLLVTSKGVGAYLKPHEEYVFGEKPDEFYEDLPSLFIRIKEFVK